MIEIRLTPVCVESVRFLCDDDTDEKLHIAIYDLIRPQITAIDTTLRRLAAAANSSGGPKTATEQQG